MIRIALAMLIRAKGRYTGLVIALAFTAFVVTQQPATFVSILARTTSLIRAIRGVDIWVMDPNVRYVDDIKPMADGALYRVRSVAGVARAEPFYKGSVRARLADGTFQNCELFAVDAASLVGAPTAFRTGSAARLREADAIIVDAAGAATMKMTQIRTSSSTAKPDDARAVPTEHILELNDARARIVGTFEAAPSFQSFPRLYTTWQRVRRFAPAERKMLSFVLVTTTPGSNPAQVARTIEARTGLKARTTEMFATETQTYFIENTGILVTFGAISGFAVVIGLFITGQTFRNFVSDSLRHFGALAAMGASYAQLVRMVVMQSLIASAVGTGLGLGMAAMTTVATSGSELSGPITLTQVAITIVLMLGVCVSVAAVSLRQIKRLEPAAVFRS